MKVTLMHYPETDYRCLLLQVQPAVAYDGSILVLLPKLFDDLSDSFINIAQISWTVSGVVMVTPMFSAALYLAAPKRHLFIL